MSLNQICLAFDFCRFCVIIRVVFIPATTANDLRLLRNFIPDFIHYIVCPIFILQKELVFPFLMLSAKQGTTGTLFITSLVWRGPWLGIEPGPPTLEASTLPLGYRGGGPWLRIEPGTSHTRSQHSTTRLSRRQFSINWLSLFPNVRHYTQQKPNRSFYLGKWLNQGIHSDTHHWQ